MKERIAGRLTGKADALVLSHRPWPGEPRPRSTPPSWLEHCGRMTAQGYVIPPAPTSRGLVLHCAWGFPLHQNRNRGAGGSTRGRAGGAGSKHQISSLKSQIPRKYQISNLKSQINRRTLRKTRTATLIGVGRGADGRVGGRSRLQQARVDRELAERPRSGRHSDLHHCYKQNGLSHECRCRCLQ
jgi:hypothetical protein